AEGTGSSYARGPCRLRGRVTILTLVVDDEPPARVAVGRLLQLDPDIEVVGSARTARRRSLRFALGTGAPGGCGTFAGLSRPSWCFVVPICNGHLLANC